MKNLRKIKVLFAVVFQIESVPQKKKKSFPRTHLSTAGNKLATNEYIE